MFLPYGLILLTSMDMADEDMHSKFFNFNLIDLIRICESDNNVHIFCIDIGILPKGLQCPSCDSTYCIRKKDRVNIQYCFQCNKKQCKAEGKKSSLH